jgi:hypothetical protein
MAVKRTYAGGGLYRNQSTDPEKQGREAWLFDFEFKGQLANSRLGFASNWIVK